jgi:hypothetical protein
MGSTAGYKFIAFRNFLSHSSRRGRKHQPNRDAAQVFASAPAPPELAGGKPQTNLDWDNIGLFFSNLDWQKSTYCPSLPAVCDDQYIGL